MSCHSVQADQPKDAGVYAAILQYTLQERSKIQAGDTLVLLLETIRNQTNESFLYQIVIESVSGRTRFVCKCDSLF